MLVTLAPFLVGALIMLAQFSYGVAHLTEKFPDSVYCNDYCKELHEEELFGGQIIVNITKLNLPRGVLLYSKNIKNSTRFDSNSVNNAEFKLATSTIQLEPSYSAFFPSTELENASYTGYYNFSEPVDSKVTGNCVGLDPALPNSIRVKEPGCFITTKFSENVNVSYTILNHEYSNNTWFQLTRLDVNEEQQKYKLKMEFEPSSARNSAISGGTVGFLCLYIFLELTVSKIIARKESFRNNVRYFCCCDCIEDMDEESD